MKDRLTLGSMRSHELTGPEVKEKLAPRKNEGVVEAVADAYAEVVAEVVVDEGVVASAEMFIAELVSSTEMSPRLSSRLTGAEE